MVTPSKANTASSSAVPVAGTGLAAVLAAGGGGKGRGGGVSPKVLDRDGSRAVAALAQQVRGGALAQQVRGGAGWRGVRVQSGTNNLTGTKPQGRAAGLSLRRGQGCSSSSVAPKASNRDSSLQRWQNRWRGRWQNRWRGRGKMTGLPASMTGRGSGGRGSVSQRV